MMKMRWIIFFGVVLVVGAAIHVRLKVTRQAELVEAQIEKLNNGPKVPAVITPPPLATPTPAKVAAPSGPNVKLRGFLNKVKNARQEFFKKHKIFVNLARDLVPVSLPPHQGVETLMLTHPQAQYTVTISVHPTVVPANKIAEQVAAQFKLASDDYKAHPMPPNVNGMPIDGGYEFELSGTTFLYMIVRHPATRKTIVILFSSRKFDNTMEEIANQVFESVKPG